MYRDKPCVGCGNPSDFEAKLTFPDKREELVFVCFICLADSGNLMGKISTLPTKGGNGE